MKAKIVAKAFFVLIVLFSAACAQLNMVAVNADEASVRYQWIYKNGQTKIYQVKREQIPNSPPLPTGYSSLNSKNYLVRTDAIVSGDNVLTLKVPVLNENEFKKVKVLRLTKNDMVPRGWEWGDCTIVPRTQLDASPQVSDDSNKAFIDGFNERMRKFMPDFANRRISCEIGRFGEQGFGEQGIDAYFALTTLAQSPPDVAFTQIQLSLEGIEQSDNNTSVYRILIKNVGNKEAAEINLRSDFDNDSTVLSAKPSQGRCQRAAWGSSDGSMVCYLGPLAPGFAASIVFQGQPSPHSGKPFPGNLNEFWRISGISKENSNDPAWSVNVFQWKPLESYYKSRQME